MSKILITMNEDARPTRSDSFGVTYKVDEHGCLRYAVALKARGHAVFFVNWNDLGDGQFERMFNYTEGRFVAPCRSKRWTSAGSTRWKVSMLSVCGFSKL